MAKSVDDLIRNVYRTFKRESHWKCPIVSWRRVKERTCKTLGICRKMLRNAIDKESEQTATDSSLVTQTRTRDSIDGFDRNLMHRTVLSMMSQNTTITLRKLKEELSKAGVNTSKTKIWKTLHSLGFRYGKADKQSKQALLERSDLAKKRFQFLRKRKELRDGNKPIFCLD